MRTLLPLALLLAGSPAAAQRPRGTFTCVASASGAGLAAQTQRLLDGRGDLRRGATTISVPLAGTTGSLDARWDVRFGLPEVARGNYSFRLPQQRDATWQVAGLAKPGRARDGALTIGGEQLRGLFAGGNPLQLILVGRDGREQARGTLDRSAFDAALDLARQADARALAKAYDYRSCPRGS